MRALVILATWTFLAGCAAQSAAERRAEPAAEAENFAATTQPEASTLEQAQKLGYKVVNEDGKTLYCRENRKLGSHVQKERVCLTEEEVADARNANQRNFENMKKVIPPRQGN